MPPKLDHFSAGASGVPPPPKSLPGKIKKPNPSELLAGKSKLQHFKAGAKGVPPPPKVGHSWKRDECGQTLHPM